MTWYVIGAESRIEATDGEPRVVTYPGEKRRALYWPSASSANRDHYRLIRGAAEEFRSLVEPHERLYARELPEDAVPELLELNTEVERMERLLEAAKAARREFLRAQVPRSVPARVSAPLEDGEEVEVRKTLGGGPYPLREWVGGYVFVLKDGNYVRVRHVGGDFDGVESVFPLGDVRRRKR